MEKQKVKTSQKWLFSGLTFVFETDVLLVVQ